MQRVNVYVDPYKRTSLTRSTSTFRIDPTFGLACVVLFGVIDKSDFNPEWKCLLRHSPLPRWQASCQKPLIYHQVQNSSLLEREVAFRINAIRETFEETGVMLAVNDNSSSSFIPDLCLFSGNMTFPRGSAETQLRPLISFM